MKILFKILPIFTERFGIIKVLFLYVTSNTEIRIYNCAEKPLFVTKDTNYTQEISKIELQTCSISDTSKLELLKSIFSQVAIDNGVIWTLEEGFEIRKRSICKDVLINILFKV